MTDTAPSGELRGASKTAVAVAMLRAWHQLFDGEPKILDDPVTPRLLGPGAIEEMRLARERLEEPLARAIRAHVVLRSRFAEERLAAAVARGMRQCVILGAGLDTFAYRQPGWARDVRLFELDHPASQRAKREQLSQSNVAIPDNLTFVSADFERVPLLGALAAAGVDLTAPVFFSWLGVTMYIPEPAVDDVFRAVATLPSSTEVVFTFAQPSADDAGSGSSPAIAERAAAVGEPWITYFEPAALSAKLRACGYATVEFLAPDEARSRYFAGRTDDLPPPRRASICSARV